MIKMYDEFVNKYNELKKKYPNLPKIEELNNEFEFREHIIEHEYLPKYMSRAIRRFMVNIITAWIGYLHEFIFPNPQSAIAFEECKYFDDKEKEEIIELMKKVMIIHRRNSKLELERDEKKDVDFIIGVFDEWKNLKKALLPKISKNIEGWKKSLK